MDGFVHFRCTNLKHKLPFTPFMLYISAVRKSNSMKHHAKNHNWKSLFYKISPLLINNLNRIHKQMDCLIIVTVPKESTRQAGEVFVLPHHLGESTMRAHSALPAVLQQNSSSSEHNQHSCSGLETDTDRFS